MERYQPMTMRPPVAIVPVQAAPTQSTPIKDSIRDMMRLQQRYQLSDELFWEIFNARVLLNEAIDVDAFVLYQS
jgi:hypothetical protein